MPEKICPVMSIGWLANKYAARTGDRTTFSLENLPDCKEENCALWDAKERLCKLGTTKR